MTLLASPKDLDAAWLQQALHITSAYSTAAVRRISTASIGQGYGWDAQIAPLTIEGDGTPPSLVAKWCPAAGAVREGRFGQACTSHLQRAASSRIVSG